MTWRTWPSPPQVSQVLIGVPGSAPLPWQCSQPSTAPKETSRRTPSRTSASCDLDRDRDVATAGLRPAATEPKMSPKPPPERPKIASKMSWNPPALGGREAARPQAVVPEGVVGAAALGVGEHLVGLGRLLELLLGVWVVGVDVGMKLAGEAPERLLDLGLVGSPVDAEDLVVVALGHAVSALVDGREEAGQLAGGVAYRVDRARVVHAQRPDDADRAEAAVAEPVVGADDADRAQRRLRVLLADTEEDRALAELASAGRKGR